MFAYPRKSILYMYIVSLLDDHDDPRVHIKTFEITDCTSHIYSIAYRAQVYMYV